MIYQIYYVLIMSGYASCSTLLGSYMMFHAGASEADIGFMFMIQPMTIILRPLICARADRYQSHKRMMAFFSLVTSLSYVPFILLPFLYGGQLRVGHREGDYYKWWVLVFFQLIGSIGFCGVRSLGDALAVHYAKRTGEDFARYRKYGSMSYGICGLALGTINQGWLLPDFVPCLLMYSASMFVLAALVYSWPDEYFQMSSRNWDDERVRRDYIESLPEPSETLKHVGRKLVDTVVCRREQNKLDRNETNRSAQWVENLTISASEPDKSQAGKHIEKRQELAKNGAGSGVVVEHMRALSIKQQLRIFGLLFMRDFRIGLYLFAIFFGGLVGYSGPNFVFTYINVVCHDRGTCDGAKLIGLVMFCYCVVETICYMLIDKFRGRLNRVLMLEVTFVSLIIHYYFYGFALEHLSPYFFLVESLHGVEYSISLSTSVELGYYFAREVELLIPELIGRGIISQDDNMELVKVSLMATMSGCNTLVYDGFGCIVGSLVFGLITGHYSFIATWITIGTLASIGFVSILLVYSIGKIFKIRPQILKIRDSQKTDQSSS